MVEDDEVRVTSLFYKVVGECNKKIEAQEAKNEQMIQMMRLLYEALDRHTLASRWQPIRESSIAHQSSLDNVGIGDPEVLVKKRDVVYMIQAHQGKTSKKKFKSPYPRYMDLIPFLPKFKQPNLQQYMCHFRALTGGICDNDALLIWLFTNILKNGTLKWFSSLEENYVTTWDKLKEDFLNFFHNVQEVTLTTLTFTTLESGESVEHFITRWSALEWRCKPKRETSKFAEMYMNNLHVKLHTKSVGTNPQSFNQLMKAACEAKLVVKQREQEKTVAKQLEGKNAAKIVTNQKKKEVMVVKAYEKEEASKVKGKTIKENNCQNPMNVLLKEKLAKNIPFTWKIWRTYSLYS